MGRSLLGRLGSLRLTLALLLALAVFAAVGTFEPIPQGLEKIRYLERFGALGQFITGLGLDHFHTSLPFRALVLLLIANLLACGLPRSVAGFKSVAALGSPSAAWPLGDREEAARALAAAGFRVTAVEPLRAFRRRYAFAGFGLVHLAPVLIVAGAFWGSAGGFVATSNIFVGAIESKFMDWSRMEENHLPFAVKPVSLTREWYPLTLRLLLKTPEGSRLGEVEVTEGERFQAGESPFQLVVDRFDPDAQDISFSVFAGPTPVGSFSRQTMKASPVIIAPQAFRGEVRQAFVSLAFYDPSGREVGSGVASVNHPVEVEGHRVFLTSWGIEEEKPYVGLQVTRDPGQWLLWLGSLLFTLGVLVLLFVEGGWAREEDGALHARSTRGRRGLEALGRGLRGE